MPSTGQAFRALIGVILLVLTIILTYHVFMSGFIALGAANTITNIAGWVMMPISLFLGFLGVKSSVGILKKLKQNEKEQQQNA